MLWYTREASVAVWVANLPMIWPLMREWLPFLRSMTGSKLSYNHTRPSGYGKGYGKGYGNGKSAQRSKNISTNNTMLGGGDVPLSDLKSGARATTRDVSQSSSNDDLRTGGFDFEVKKFGRRDRSPDSDERVLNQGQQWGKGLGDIRQETTIEVEVEHESVDLEKGYRSRRASPGTIEWGDGTRPIREVKIEGAAAERGF